MQLPRIGRTVGVALGAAALIGISVGATIAIPADAQPAQASSVAKPRPVLHSPAGKDAVTPLHAACGVNGPVRDTASGHVLASTTILNGTVLTCPGVERVSPSRTLRYRCFTLAHDGFTWTNVTDQITGETGWVRDNNLSDGGSFVPCGL